MMQRVPALLALIFVLLFAQQAGMCHALTHFAEGGAASRQHEPLPHPGGDCDECLAHAGMAAALPAAAIPPLISSPSSLPADEPFATPVVAPIRAYLSRAPPFLA